MSSNPSSLQIPRRVVGLLQVQAVAASPGQGREVLTGLARILVYDANSTPSFDTHFVNLNLTLDS